MLKPGLLKGPTEKPVTTLSSAILIILLKAYITITNNNGESGSPWRIPLELLKKPAVSPFTKPEYRTEEIQNAIQSLHFSPKPHFCKRSNKKF
jgi:hypothetical protein